MAEVSSHTNEEAAQAEELFRAAALRQQVEEPESQSDDEGAGWRGRGNPLSVGSGPAERELHDGAGL